MQQKSAHRKKPELLAPGGSLSQALWALEAGADAIYAGWKQHSARSGAENLDIPDFVRLIRSAHRQGSRVYATFNTLLEPAALEPVSATLWELWEAGLDGVIIQDLGLLDVLQQLGPPLELHASTQMAVQDAAGAAFLRDCGLARVVLARELTLEEIRAIRQTVPEIELEVFVTGAQCYSASGQCRASWQLCGRSANRGACAQICRNRLRLAEPGQPEREGSWFSMNDLDLMALAGELAGMGIDSFKIEGRMKGPLYARAWCQAWRQRLDHLDAPDRTGQATAALERARSEAALAFARKLGSGFAASPRGTDLINPDWAGSTGLAAGSITALGPRDLTVRNSCELAAKDGLLLLGPDASLRCGIQSATPRGQQVRIVPALDSPAARQAWNSLQAAFARGQPVTLRKVSDHRLNLPALPPGPPPAAAALPPGPTGATRPASALPQPRRLVLWLDCRAAADASLVLDTRLGWWPDAADGPAASGTGAKARQPVELARFSLTSPQPAQARTGATGLDESLRQLFASPPGHLEWLELGTAPELAGLFLPPAILKELRREWKARTERTLADWRTRQAALAAGFPAGEAAVAAIPATPDGGLAANPATAASLPYPAQPSTSRPTPEATAKTALPRSGLTALQDGLPWLDLPELAGLSADRLQPIQSGGREYRVLSLWPTVFGQAPGALETALLDLLERHPDCHFLVGLNNLSQVATLARLGRQTARLRPWADQQLNLANPRALAWLQRQLPDLWGWMPAVESGTWPSPGLVPVLADREFRPPVFLSRSCFRHQSIDLPCPLDRGQPACARPREWRLDQPGRPWRVLVKHCQTFAWCD